MKLKPIHIILIVIVVIEIIVLGCILGWKGTFAGSTHNPELLITYDADSNGRYSVLSLFENMQEPDITFQYNGTEYVFDQNIINITSAYRSYDTFTSLQANATPEMWNAYKDAVSRHVAETLRQEHPVMTYIRNIASAWYNVPDSLLQSNQGFYTLNTYASIAQWESVFSQYRIQQNNSAANEMALGAIVKIDNIEYPAIAYMVITDDGDDKNNATASEVTIHVVFGKDFLQDINAQDATITYLTPDGSQIAGYSEMKVQFFASPIESRYRELSLIGGTNGT